MLSLLSPQTNSHIIYNIHYTLYTLHIYVIHAHNLFTGLNNAQFPLGVYTVRIPSVKKIYSPDKGNSSVCLSENVIKQ